MAKIKQVILVSVTSLFIIFASSPEITLCASHIIHNITETIFFSTSGYYKSTLYKPRLKHSFLYGVYIPTAA